ncbi:Aminopeptidase N [Rubellimicrobium thermophilum DSM 16684]|uniref:Aminopeptidase N n=1 Tax=Rubellimicrobium thermophilum DSM 16684 TaxID=1123069 RepID=S9SLC7_9RHOB|nr:Aminopeptidase N [Rubellimicrobium thermophilum DSM 16684]
MAEARRETIHLKDYTPFPWIVEAVELTFLLRPEGTRVSSRIRFRPNPGHWPGRFFLHGEDLRLIEARIDGMPVSPEITPEGLTCEVPARAFTWDAVVEIDPARNTRLEGLYLSKGMYCTQCEAEGFRRITYYPDRPDVLAPFRVRIESDLPVMLSNGKSRRLRPRLGGMVRSLAQALLSLRAGCRRSDPASRQFHHPVRPSCGSGRLGARGR